MRAFFPPANSTKRSFAGSEAPPPSRIRVPRGGPVDWAAEAAVKTKTTSRAIARARSMGEQYARSSTSNCENGRVLNPPIFLCSSLFLLHAEAGAGGAAIRRSVHLVRALGIGLGDVVLHARRTGRPRGTAEGHHAAVWLGNGGGDRNAAGCHRARRGAHGDGDVLVVAVAALVGADSQRDRQRVRYCIGGRTGV